MDTVIPSDYLVLGQEAFPKDDDAGHVVGSYLCRCNPFMRDGSLVHRRLDGRPVVDQRFKPEQQLSKEREATLEKGRRKPKRNSTKAKEQ
jgi:hypothetical protein